MGLERGFLEVASIDAGFVGWMGKRGVVGRMGEERLKGSVSGTLTQSHENTNTPPKKLIRVPATTSEGSTSTSSLCGVFFVRTNRKKS
jgi:hypothetical protein